MIRATDLIFRTAGVVTYVSVTPEDGRFHDPTKVRLELCLIEESGEATSVGFTQFGKLNDDGSYIFRLTEPVAVGAGLSYRLREVDEGDRPQGVTDDVSFRLRMPLQGGGGAGGGVAPTLVSGGGSGGAYAPLSIGAGGGGAGVAHAPPGGGGAGGAVGYVTFATGGGASLFRGGGGGSQLKGPDPQGGGSSS